jgi:hypothetical protein
MGGDAAIWQAAYNLYSSQKWLKSDRLCAA